MAVLYITEYANVGRSAEGSALPGVPREPNVAEQAVAIGGTTAQSAAFNAKTQFVMVHTDAICAIKFGDDPTAVNNRHRLAANETRLYAVSPGQKLAVISTT